jgi:hypothetical protein
MKKYLLLSTLLTTTFVCRAQVPEDVLRYSFFPQTGNARSLAIGGAMGSLGGDINATFVNPAGLGNYKTGEFVFTPNFFLNSNKTDYRDTRNKNKKNNLSFGQIGIVYGAANRYNPTNSQAISLAFTQTASYNNRIQYRGYNNFSSGAEQWAEEVSKSGLTIDQITGDQQYAYGSGPALYTYLVDTMPSGNGTVVKSLPELILDNNMALLQEKTISTSGGMYEFALGYAYNQKDKLLIGGSLGIPIVYYKNNTVYKERDTSSSSNNNFGYFNYTDNFKTTGAGINAKLGLIYRPQEYIRLGIALHTPSYMFSLKDERSTTLEVQAEKYRGNDDTVRTISSTDFGPAGASKYTMLTPWKVIISGSYVFREIQDVRKQKGFITADIEYVHHKGSSFYSAQENPDEGEINYFKSLNQVIRGEYKGNFNFRVGGELKFNVLMARLGFAYYSNPYKDKALKASRMLLSGGLGYRHKGFFIDLTYVHSFNKDVDFAYRLQDKSNTFASVKNQRGNIVASVGFKF